MVDPDDSDHHETRHIGEVGRPDRDKRGAIVSVPISVIAASIRLAAGSSSAAKRPAGRNYVAEPDMMLR
jgi:hypothetical protein